MRKYAHTGYMAGLPQVRWQYPLGIPVIADNGGNGGDNGGSGCDSPTLVSNGSTNSVVMATSGNLAVAVGDAGEILTSTDGIAWSPQTSGTEALSFPDLS